jgi:hypothetical protein
VDQRVLSKHALEAASFYIGVSDDLEGRAFLGEFHSAVTRAKST